MTYFIHVLIIILSVFVTRNLWGYGRMDMRDTGVRCTTYDVIAKKIFRYLIVNSVRVEMYASKNMYAPAYLLSLFI